MPPPTLHYILDGTRPLAVDLATWLRWHGGGGAVIARDMVGETLVRTDFLGFGDAGPVFQTRVYDGPLNWQGEHAASHGEALAAHARTLDRVRLARLH